METEGQPRSVGVGGGYPEDADLRGGCLHKDFGSATGGVRSVLCGGALGTENVASSGKRVDTGDALVVLR